MLIEKKEKQKKKIASYRLDSEILEEFRELCKKRGLVQTHILENAMKQAIGEMKAMEKEDDR